MISRLTYERLTGHSAEGFWRANHESGLFFKGYLGGGSISSGRFIDEDFPPDTDPYSRTVSQQKDGLIGYISADLGYELLNCKNFDLGGFIGYSYWREDYDTFGLKQTATSLTFPVASIVNALNNKAKLNSLRLGVNSNIAFRRLVLSADAAYIHSYRNAHDFHNLRPELRPLLNDGYGNGVQLDGIVNWTVCPGFAVGVGGRWWHVFTKGYSHFEETFVTGVAQHSHIKHDRYGLIVHAKYVFDNGCMAPCMADVSSFCWRGVYFGPQVGYGTLFNNVSINSTSIPAIIIQILEPTPNQLHVRNSGFLGGGQVGYNWQRKRYVVGIEGDFDYSGISGSNAVTTSTDTLVPIANITTTATTRIKWLATLRGRLGILCSSRLLAYLTGGPAFGKARIDYDQRLFTDPSLLTTSGSHSQTKTGWTAGTGFEYAVNRCFSFKTEYLFVHLGKVTANSSGESLITDPAGLATYQVNCKFASHTIRLGLNYKL